VSSAYGGCLTRFHSSDTLYRAGMTDLNLAKSSRSVTISLNEAKTAHHLWELLLLL